MSVAGMLIAGGILTSAIAIVAVYGTRLFRNYAALQTKYVVAIARNKQLEAENAMLSKQADVYATAVVREAKKHADQDRDTAASGSDGAVLDAIEQRLRTPLGGKRTDRDTGNTAQDVSLPVAGLAGTNNVSTNED